MSSFGKDSIYYGGAVLIDRVLGFALLPVLTHGLEPSQFGIWTQVHASYGFYSTVALLGFYYTISDVIGSRAGAAQAELYSAIFSFVLIAIVLLSGVGLTFRDTLAEVMFGDARIGWMMPHVLFFMASEALFELVVLTFVRNLGRLDRCARYVTGKSMGRFIAVSAAVMLGLGVEWMLIALGVFNLCLAWAAIRLDLVRRGAEAHSLRLAWGIENQAFWLARLCRSLSAVGAVLVAWANLSLNRFVLVRTGGIEEVSVYAANFALMSVLTMVSMVLGFAVLHHVGSGLAKGEGERAGEILADALGYYLALVVPAAAILLAWYDGIFTAIIPDGYQVGMFLPLTLAAMFVLYGLEQILVFATVAHASGAMLRARLLGLLVNIVLSSVVIPLWGVTGAAVPPLVSAAIVVGLCAAVAKRRIAFQIPWQVGVRLAPAVGAMIAAWGAVRWSLEGTSIAQAALGVGAMAVAYVVVELMGRGSLLRAIMGEVGRMRGGGQRRRCERER